MATSADLSRLNALLPGLARSVRDAARDKFGNGGWVAAVLDARFFEDSSGSVSKVRVELAGGGQGSLRLPAEGSVQLRQLNEARPEGDDRWYGLRLRVTAEGGCKTEFNYDPTCAEDESFFDA
jgi:hypothetical protein